MIPPTSENICAVVVTYHPDLTVIERLDIIAGQVSHLIVVDNASTEDEKAAIRERATESNRITVIENATNLGIATALNQAAQLAMTLGFHWLLQFDQDTEVTPSLAAVLSHSFSHVQNPERWALIGSNATDRFGRCVVHPGTGSQIIPRYSVVTSGSLLSLAAYSAVGGYRDDFFIDSVDREYCLRLIAAGYCVGVCDAVVMRHEPGRQSRYALLGVQLPVSNHSVLRRYYITRNWLIVLWLYCFKNPRAIGREFLVFLVDTALSVTVEEQPGQKLKAVLTGVWHALVGRTGAAPVTLLSQERGNPSDLNPELTDARAPVHSVEQ